MKERVNEIIVPDFLTRYPKVLNKRRIYVSWRLNNKIVMNRSPKRIPRGYSKEIYSHA